MLTPDQLSAVLYEASVAGFHLVAECEGERVHSYAFGPTMGDALAEYFHKRDGKRADQ